MIYTKCVFAKVISTLNLEILGKKGVNMISRHICYLLMILLISSSFWIGVNWQPEKTTVAAMTPDPVFESLVTSGNYTNVILLGWDGVQRNHLYELINAGLMPNLSAFVQTGKLVNITVSDHYTDTKAGWTQILTGYKWWKTGVFSNHIWFHSIPKGYTIPERLENIFGSNQIATAFITGKLNQMEIDDGTGTAAVGNTFATYSNEALYANLPSQLDVVSVGDLAEDRYANVTGPLMLQFLQSNVNNRFFAFFHFSDPDHLGHLFGENSPEYSAGIETCDSWLGQILNSLNTLGLSQKTLIYITADHGFDEGGFNHMNAPYVFLATNDNNVTRNGDEVDIAPTVYYGLDLWNQSFNPALDGYPLQLPLPVAEDQHRQSVLNDTDNLLKPLISIADTGHNQKTLYFNATDSDLASVFLLIDNTLKTDVQLTWNTTGTVTASGSYTLDTASLTPGTHNVQILAFDEHAANNGGPGNIPTNGGSPSTNGLDFTVATTATPSSTPMPSQSPTEVPSPSLSPSATATPAAPEFPSVLLPIFIIIGSLALVVLTKKRSKNVA